MELSAQISKFESLATLDGEGIRCAVFLCGCPMRCVYCHNPETWLQCGTTFTASELCRKIARYKSYFGKPGGATFSGGEPLLHARFINECANILSQDGIGYWLDTSGGVELTDDVKRVLDGAQGVILDLKFYTAQDYKKYTDGDMDRVLAVGDYLDSAGVRTWIRTVIVPDINDSESDIDGYIQVADRWKNAEKYELLGFHTMGFSKYDNLHIKNPLQGYNPLSPQRLENLQSYLDSKRK